MSISLDRGINIYKNSNTTSGILGWKWLEGSWSNSLDLLENIILPAIGSSGVSNCRESQTLLSDLHEAIDQLKE